MTAQRVRDVIVRAPKTLPTAAVVADARDVFADDHVHMVLLTDDDRLAGALVRADLDGARHDAPALAYASLQDRLVDADEVAEVVRLRMLATGRRRLAVVEDDARLLGLLCLKRHGRGFCSDADVAARALDHHTC